MGTIQGSTGRALVLTASLLAAPGCAQWGDTWGGLRPHSVRNVVLDGEVRSVDRRGGRIQIRGDRGRTNTVFVDNATRVTYDRRSYRVDALERGDVVRVWLEVDRRGDAWADRVDVRASVRDRDRSRNRDRTRYDDGYRMERLDGRVVELNLRDRYITVEQGRDRTVAVYLPDGLAREELRKVERLRRGDRVQMDVRTGSGDQAELVGVR